MRDKIDKKNVKNEKHLRRLLWTRRSSSAFFRPTWKVSKRWGHFLRQWWWLWWGWWWLITFYLGCDFNICLGMIDTKGNDWGEGEGLMVTRKQMCGFFHPDEQTSSSKVQLHNFCTWIALDKDKADWQELSAKVTSAPEHFSRILHHITSTSTLLLLMKTVKGTRHVEHGVCHNAGMRHQGNCDCMAKMGKNAPRKIKVPRNVEAHWENWHGQ